MKNDKLYNVDVSSEQSTPTVNQFSASAGFEAELEKVKKEVKAPNRLMFVAIGIIGLILMMVVAGLFLVISGGAESPLSQALGLSGTGVTGLLYVVVGIVFGTITLAGLILGMYGVFKLSNTRKDDKTLRSKALKVTVAGSVAVLIGLIGMIFAFSSVSSVPVVDVNQEIIETNPAVTTGLTAPVSITFLAGTLPIDQNKFSIVSYNWSFGDGEVATGSVVTHTYQTKPASGVYTVTLKVSYQEIGNLQGELQEEEYTRVVAIENEQVFATFTYSPETGQAPLEVTFDASESKDPDGQIVKYEWDFNEDGIFDKEGVKVTHTFTEVRSYNVVLKVTDNNGETNTAEHVIAVKSSQIITSIVKNLPADEVLVPTRAYQFDAAESVSTEGTITSYEWNFGDGSLKNGRRVTHAFAKEGVYEVSLVLKDDAGNRTVYAKNYTVSESGSGLFAKFSTLPALTNNQVEGTVPLRVSFDAGSSSGGDIVDFQWDFDNDGVIDANGQTAEYVFTSAGEFNSTLTIVSADEKTAKTAVKVLVTGSSFEARITANPITGIAPLTVNFDATSTKLPEGEKITAFRWDFGDGSPLLTQGPIVTHKYATPGTFKAKVTAVTASNKNSSAEINIIITTTPLKACFTVSRKIGPAPLTVEFNPRCSTGSVNNFSWKFGSVGNSTERAPTFTFQKAGTYEVTLEVSDSNNNVNSFVDTVTAE